MFLGNISTDVLDDDVHAVLSSHFDAWSQMVTASQFVQGQGQVIHDMSQEASKQDDEDMASVSDATDSDDLHDVDQDGEAYEQHLAQHGDVTNRPEAGQQQQLQINGHVRPSPDEQQSSDESEASTEDDDEDAAAAVHQVQSLFFTAIALNTQKNVSTLRCPYLEVLQSECNDNSAIALSLQ